MDAKLDDQDDDSRMMFHTDLGSWFREFDQLYDQTFREVSLIAVGIVVGSPTVGAPRIDWAGVVFGDFTRRHRWRPHFHGRLE
jgi:hypothetical protein